MAHAANSKPRIAITLGDPNGIGPEVVLKALRDSVLARGGLEPLLIGSRAVLRRHASRLGVDFDWPLEEPAEMGAHEVRFGETSGSAGRQAMRAVEHAVELCLSGAVDAMVTAPISKEAIGSAGYDAPGHTEFIARLCDRPNPLMMLVSGPLRVALVTGHLPLRDVAAAVTPKSVAAGIRRLESALRSDFGIQSPDIAVLGLNPHAGDGGVLGTEEREIIGPAIEAHEGGASGPYPADGFFAERSYERFDAVLAMYHDQGLIPFKTLAFDTGVNFTAGLPIVRTSPDHGTAFDIAGEGKARPDSMRNAIEVAMQIVRARAGTETTA